MLSIPTLFVTISLLLSNSNALEINIVSNSSMKCSYIFYARHTIFNGQLKGVLSSLPSYHKTLASRIYADKLQRSSTTSNHLIIVSALSTGHLGERINYTDSTPSNKLTVCTSEPISSIVSINKQRKHLLEYPHKCLRSINYDFNINQLYSSQKIITYYIKKMFCIMYENGGVGISAPQLGINKRIFVYNPTGDSKKWMKEIVMVNPKITEFSSRKELGKEGCLSFPYKDSFIERSKWIKVEYYNPNGKRKSEKLNGWEARIVQHEYDHLNGVLLIDRDI